MAADRSGRRGAPLEIEVKAPVSDLRAFERRIRARGARYGGELRQADRYFNHPKRDFARTDEALRIRVTRSRRSGSSRWTTETVITYKGPKIDPLSKTRKEIEFAVGPAAVEILRRLRFREVATVHKVRRVFRMPRFQILLDRVRGVGTYAEVEWAGPDWPVARARDAILRFLRGSGVDGNERRSYLELFLANRRRSRARLRRRSARRS